VSEEERNKSLPTWMLALIIISVVMSLLVCTVCICVCMGCMDKKWLGNRTEEKRQKEELRAIQEEREGVYNPKTGNEYGKEV
jgi:hypothetical protein